MRHRPVTSRAAAGAFFTMGALAAAGLPGCGPAPQVRGPLADRDASKYLPQCDDRTSAHKKDLDSGAYNPPVLFVHTWPAGLRPNQDLFMPEAQLVSALDAGDVKRVFVTARGGLGKTRLAEAIRAQVCHTTPVFSVDLKQVAAGIRAGAVGAAAVFDVITKEVGVQSAEAKAGLQQTLTEVRFVLLADAMEEVELVERGAVLERLGQIAVACPNLQLVLLARPPVFDDDYGFGAEAGALGKIDARLEIPPLACSVADAFVARAYKTEADRERFRAFAKRHGLDEQTRFGMQCLYPYLSTYRDIQTLAKFEQAAAKDKGAEFASRSAVYESLIGTRLVKEFENLKWSTPEALDMVDRIVRAQSGKTGQHNLTFDVPTCILSLDARWGELAVDAGVGGTPEQRREHVCEKTFQSALFQKTDGSHAFTFADRGTTDLFLARWLNGELARSPTNDCAIVGQHQDLLAGPGVVRFFASQPLGARCLAHTIGVLCDRAAAATGDHVKLLDEGLPGGPARVQPLQDARAMASAQAQKACVVSVLDALDKTVAAP
ncbi:MAG: hypothetical protein EXR79_03985 [Myxococcales bacterium]|nr:hypothetical protein [Myxococcales bacterium]